MKKSMVLDALLSEITEPSWISSYPECDVHTYSSSSNSMDSYIDCCVSKQQRSNRFFSSYFLLSHLTLPLIGTRHTHNGSHHENTLQRRYILWEKNPRMKWMLKMTISKDEMAYLILSLSSIQCTNSSHPKWGTCNWIANPTQCPWFFFELRMLLLPHLTLATNYVHVHLSFFIFK